MSRVQLIFAFLAVGLAVLSLTTAQSSNKPECAPLQDLYREWIASCTGNLQSIPNTDADPRWKPCVCKPGFFPIAQAIEKCTLTGTSQPQRINADSMDALCKGQANYQVASAQPTPSPLTPALATSTNIALEQRKGSSGGGGGGGGSSSAADHFSAGFAWAISMVVSVLVAATIF